MFAKRLTKIFTSLRLTVVLLAFGIILVFVGTVAQADEGLYNAQSRYFKQWLVFGVTMFGKRLPLILPGGYLIGFTLVINLVAAHIYRFQKTWKKLGLHVAHAGVVLLLVGQLATDFFARETQLRFSEGETKSYAESAANYELVFVTSADEKSNQEIIVPLQRLVHGGEIKSEQLPFAVRVKSFSKNSSPSFRAPMMKNGPPLTTNGIATSFDFQETADVKRMDDRNVPTALVEIVGPNESLGDWVVSGWTAEEMAGMVQDSYARQMGPQMAQKIGARLTEPQSFNLNGRTFELKLRPERIYMPFSLTLLKATHTTYPGRPDIPRDFRSRVRLVNPAKSENREVEVYMNSPLRYGGLTFYQYQMSAGEEVTEAGRVPSSVLQVVRNPTWLTPYIGCFLVALGLLIQFLTHLVAFISKRAMAGQPSAVRAKRSAQSSEVQPV
jgi:hypothetical protein